MNEINELILKLTNKLNSKPPVADLTEFLDKEINQTSEEKSKLENIISIKRDQLSQLEKL